MYNLSVGSSCILKTCIFFRSFNVMLIQICFKYCIKKDAKEAKINKDKNFKFLHNTLATNSIKTCFSCFFGSKKIHDIPLVACLYNFGYPSNWNYESKIRTSKFIERISQTKWSNINNLM